MKAKVGEQGLLLPKDLFGSIDEVEIRKDNDVITIVPVSGDDPIFGLGKNPVPCGVPDGSECHDRYLYGGNG
jgi:hypothetical protein